MISGLRQLCLLGGALLLPLFVSAHNGEWLLVKCTIEVDQSVTVRITADAELNPRIQTEADLRRESKGLLLLHDGQTTRDFLTFADQVNYGTDDRLDPAAPLGHTPEELAKRYTLMKCTARARLTPAKFTLQLPEGSPHTLILWLLDERLPLAQPRWVMLIGGDESPLIEVNPQQERSWWRRRRYAWVSNLGILLLIGLSLVICRWLVRKMIP